MYVRCTLRRQKDRSQPPHEFVKQGGPNILLHQLRLSYVLHNMLCNLATSAETHPCVHSQHAQPYALLANAMPSSSEDVDVVSKTEVFSQKLGTYINSTAGGKSEWGGRLRGLDPTISQDWACSSPGNWLKRPKLLLCWELGGLGRRPGSDLASFSIIEKARGFGLDSHRRS